MLDHIVNQVVSGATETPEEPDPPSRQKRLRLGTSETQGNENR